MTLTSTLPPLTHANHLNQETSGITSETGSTIQIQLALPKENGTISIMCNDKTLSDAIVLGWGRTSTGKNKSSINVRLNDIEQCISLDKLHWKNAV